MLFKKAGFLSAWIYITVGNENTVVDVKKSGHISIKEMWPDKNRFNYFTIYLQRIRRRICSLALIQNSL